MQVQQRQHLRDPRGLPRPRRHNRGSEPTPLPGDLIDPLVIDPRRLHRHRTRRGDHITLDAVPIADHQPMTGLIDLAFVGLDVGADLGLQRDREHLPGRVTNQRIKHRRAAVTGAVLVGLRLLLDYLEHGRTFPNQRVNAGS